MDGSPRCWQTVLARNPCPNSTSGSLRGAGFWQIRSAARGGDCGIQIDEKKAALTTDARSRRTATLQFPLPFAVDASAGCAQTAGGYADAGTDARKRTLPFESKASQINLS
ncbi:hypothetical protein SBBP2_1670005 [Burkholderiales bacterium]|nr:hypothetical protein SBBP2_1670005 [Burkholderiales bacterium]